MNSVEITVGHRWEDDVRHIHSLRSRRPADSSLNLLELRDIIDIVIDGTNLTASVTEESIFGLVEHMLSSLVELIDEKSHKAIIEFHHEPWEMVLVPDGASLQLSLYSVDRRRRVVARDLPIDARSFIDAICEVAEKMLTGLFRVSEHFSSDTRVRNISQALARLKRTRRVQFPPRTISGDDSPIGMRVASTSSSEGLTLGYQFDGDDMALRRYRGDQVFDLHALLFDGQLEAEFGVETFTLCRGYPFFAIVSLLDRTRQLFNQLESHADAAFVLDESLPHLQLEVEGEAGRWNLRICDVDDDKWRSWDTRPAKCLDALVSVAELFTQDLARANPNLEVNQRYLDLQKEVEKLRHWHRDLCGNNLYHDRPEKYLRQLGHLEPTSAPGLETPSFPWPLASVHTLFPERIWSLRTERIDFSSLALSRDSVLVSTSDAIRCLDSADGTTRWRRELGADFESDDSMILTGEKLVVSTGTEKLIVLDAADGSLEATIATDHRWRRLSGAARYGDSGLTVAADQHGSIIGFDAIDATVHWTHSTGPGKIQNVVLDGPLVCVQSTEGVITTLNPRSGEVLWKVRIGGTPELPTAIHEGRFYTVTHDPLHRGSTLHALYPFTGRTVWQLRLSAISCGPPSFIGQWMLLPLERHGQIQLAGIDLEAVDPRIHWRLDLSSAGIDRPTPVLPVTIDDSPHGLVRTDRAELTCFSVLDGQVRWRSMPASETLLLHGNLPLFQIDNAVVNVSDTVDLRELATGRLLHSFSAIEAPEFGFLTAPFRLLFGEQAPGGKQADQLTAYSVEHFLALVDG